VSLFAAIDIAGSGLTAERVRMDVAADNLANAQSTRSAAGGPYRRKLVLLRSAEPGGFAAVLGRRMAGAAGVEVAGIVEDTTPGPVVYDPGHPDADRRGYVRMPNVNPVSELVDLITASRAYEANVTSMQTAKQMFSRTLEILR